MSTLPSHKSKTITFDHLWTILPPDCLIVGKDTLGYDSIWRVIIHRKNDTTDGVFLSLEAESLVWDGVKAGYKRQTLRIPAFKGIMEIQHLPYAPLDFHPKRDLIIEQARERSRKALAYWQPGFRHEEYHGTGLAQVGDKVEKYPVSRETHPANTHTVLRLLTAAGVPSSTAGW